MNQGKAIVIGSEPEQRLEAFVADLSLPRRAITVPLPLEPKPEISSFVELWGADADLRAAVDRWPFAASAWLVDEHAPLLYDRTWPSGVTSPGVRMVSSLHRRASLSREAFAAHWLGPHTEVARSYTIPVWHYNQNVVREALTPGASEDGFVGMQFRTQEQLRARWAEHPQEAARGARDAERFMDVSRSASMMGLETVWEDA